MEQRKSYGITYLICLLAGFWLGDVGYQFATEYAPQLFSLDGKALSFAFLGEFFTSVMTRNTLGISLEMPAIISGVVAALVIVGTAAYTITSENRYKDPTEAYGTARWATVEERAQYAHITDTATIRYSLLDFAHDKLGYRGDTKDFRKKDGTVLSRLLSKISWNKKVPWPKPDYCETIEDDNIILSKHSRIAFSDSPDRLHSPANRHIYLIAGSGSGKTFRFVKTNLMQLNASFAFTDPKGELYRDTAKFLTNNGYDVRVVDLRDEKGLMNGDRINPFANAENMTDIDDIVSMFIKTTSDPKSNDQQFFKDMEKAVYSAVAGALHFLGDMLYKNTGDPAYLNMCTFPAILDHVIELKTDGYDKCALEIFFDGTTAEDGFYGYRQRILELHGNNEEEARNSPEWAPLISWDSYRSSGDSPETRASIEASCNARLNLFGRAAVRKLFSEDTLNLEQIGKKKMAFFFIINEQGGPYDFAAAIALSQLFSVNSNIAKHSESGHLDIPVICYLDELANIGQIRNLEKLFAVMRGYWINLVAITQDLSQLKNVYGDFAKSIYSNSATTLYFGGSDHDTAEEISKEIGDETVPVKSESVSRAANGSISVSESTQYIRARLIEASELRSDRFKGDDMNSPGQCVNHLTETYWFLDSKPDPISHKRWKELISAGKARIEEYSAIRDARKVTASIEAKAKSRRKTIRSPKADVPAPPPAAFADFDYEDEDDGL